MQVNESWKPTIVAFCCNWCSYAGADLSGTNRLQYPANVKIIRQTPIFLWVGVAFFPTAFYNRIKPGELQPFFANSLLDRAKMEMRERA